MANVKLDGFRVGKSCFDPSIGNWNTIGVHIETSATKELWWPATVGECNVGSGVSVWWVAISAFVPFCRILKGQEVNYINKGPLALEPMDTITLTAWENDL